MIIAHLDRENFEAHEINDNNADLLLEAVWIDLLSPTLEEENYVEKLLNLDIPTRAEMVEIELSNRLYKEGSGVFMTASIISHSDTLEPLLDPVSFVLTENQLFTVRYVAPKTFSIFSEQLDKTPRARRTAPSLLVALLNANINRLADILEIIGRHLDEYSKQIFAPLGKKDIKPNYLSFMQQIGFNGDLNTKARESLLTFHRLIPFLQQTAGMRMDEEAKQNLITLHKDINALSDHANFMANKITFLLDATLGMINIEQNNIIKIVSVAAVIFLPPTLIASIYGMNFEIMPELRWKFGYATALILMLLASWLPFKYFKRRKWL